MASGLTGKPTYDSGTGGWNPLPSVDIGGTIDYVGYEVAASVQYTGTYYKTNGTSMSASSNSLPPDHVVGLIIIGGYIVGFGYADINDWTEYGGGHAYREYSSNSTYLIRNFTVPDYLANEEYVYCTVRFAYKVGTANNISSFWVEGVNISKKITIPTSSYNSSYFKLAKCVRSYSLSSSISYPSFTCSKYSKLTTPKTKNAYKAEFYRSTDNGSSWSKIKEVSTGTAVSAATTWSISTLNLGTVSDTFNCAPPIPAQSIDVSDATVSCKYKAIYYGEGTNYTATGSNLMEILDLSIPSPANITESAHYSNRTAEKFAISNTTITDLSRISFKEMFARTSLPGTTQPCVADTLEYDVQALDENNSLETNLGNYFLLPNASYEYRIYPLLDGSTAYKSTNNNTYQKFNYTKSTTKLEMTRPIEMGSIQPTKIKLLLNPSIDKLPSGATLTFYVANNGNDENIVWEELPSSCLGTAANPDCDIYYFTNESKTADTWKVMVKVVADKGTASAEVTLKSLVVVINGGEADDRPSGYKYLTNVVLDATATTVNLEMPQGYRKYKIIGNIVNKDKRGNPYIRLNSLAKTYDTYCYYNTSSTTKTDRFCYVDTTTGICPQFEMELFCYDSKWYGSMKAVGDAGYSNSHSIMSITGDLSTINIICSSTTYPMQPGTEFTILGVD